jgi:hypothetical protein
MLLLPEKKFWRVFFFQINVKSVDIWLGKRNTFPFSSNFWLCVCNVIYITQDFEKGQFELNKLSFFKRRNPYIFILFSIKMWTEKLITLNVIHKENLFRLKDICLSNNIGTHLVISPTSTSKNQLINNWISREKKIIYIE